MQFSELTSLSDEALVHKELQLERELLELRFRHKTNQLRDSSSLKKVRRDIARCRTAQRSREREQGLARDALRNAHRGTFSAAQGTASVAAAGAGFLQGMAERFGGGEESQEGQE